MLQWSLCDSSTDIRSPQFKRGNRSCVLFLAFIFIAHFVQADDTLVKQQEQISTASNSKYLDPDWIEKRLDEVGIEELLKEYKGKSDANVSKVKSVLSLSKLALTNHPEALREHLQARLLSLKNDPAFSQFQTFRKTVFGFVLNGQPLLNQAVH